MQLKVGTTNNELSQYPSWKVLTGLQSKEFGGLLPKGANNSLENEVGMMGG
jgi:hypothetical protein